MNNLADISSGTSIFRAIRKRICTLELPYGSVLREVELAKDFGVSRTPIRQALHHLAAFDLVETRNGVGTIVTAGDPKTLADIYELRIHLAGLIGTLATTTCPKGAAEDMLGLQKRVVLLKDGPSKEDFWQLNEDRHKIINEIVENRELRVLHDLFYYKVAPFWFLLFQQAPEREFDYLIREVQETAFWMENGNMLTVANMQQNHTAMAAMRMQAASIEPNR